MPKGRYEKASEGAEEEIGLFKRIAAGVALNKFPPRQLKSRA